MNPPTTEAIRALRVKMGLTQADAAKLVHVSLRAWQQWEGGQHKMPRNAWELFQLKTGEIKVFP